MWPRLISGRRACCPVGLAAVCAGGRRPVAWLVAPTDLRPPRGLPARSPSAPRASLGASSRSPARPRRPRGGLQSGGACGACACSGPAAAHRHRGLARVSQPVPAVAHGHRGLALPSPTGSAAWPRRRHSTFACNSPPALCCSVSVCNAMSLVFLNCMRLLLGWRVSLLGSWWLGPGVHLWGRFARESQSVSGVPAKTRREQRVETDPTVMADDDREQVRTPARATHTDCG